MKRSRPGRASKVLSLYSHRKVLKFLAASLKKTVCVSVWDFLFLFLNQINGSLAACQRSLEHPPG